MTSTPSADRPEVMVTGRHFPRPEHQHHLLEAMSRITASSALVPGLILDAESGTGGHVRRDGGGPRPVRWCGGARHAGRPRILPSVLPAGAVNRERGSRPPNPYRREEAAINTREKR